MLLTNVLSQFFIVKCFSRCYQAWCRSHLHFSLKMSMRNVLPKYNKPFFFQSLFFSFPLSLFSQNRKCVFKTTRIAGGNNCAHCLFFPFHNICWKYGTPFFYLLVLILPLFACLHARLMAKIDLNVWYQIRCINCFSFPHLGIFFQFLFFVRML